MYCILVIGMTGEGKSTFVKNLIGETRACYVFDVQNEYQGLPVSATLSRCRDTSLKEKDFIKNVLNRKNTICVFEEATGFFEGRTAPDMRRVLLSKRHSGNIIVLCFHSISSVPPRIMQFTNIAVIFKTLDEDYQVQNKFPSLYPAYLKVKKLPKYGKVILKLINQ